MTSHLVRPVGQGNARFSVSAGGPLLIFHGAPVPVPVTTVGAAYGVRDDVDVHADLHPTAAAYGIAGLDVGFAWHPLHGPRGALTLGGAVYGFGNGQDAVLLADPWLGGMVRVASWFSLSLGMHNMLRVDTSDPTLRSTFPWAPSPFLGLAFRTSGTTELELEFRWDAAASNARLAAPQYVNLGDYGTLGVLLGFNYQLQPDVAR
jgi:hypothetical protein